MSFLARALRSPRAPTLASRTLTPASFHTTSITRALSESDHDDPDRASKIDASKADSVQKGKEGKGEWKSELASNSEQAVAGEKHNMSMKEMQELGEKKAQQGKQPSSGGSSGRTQT